MAAWTAACAMISIVVCYVVYMTIGPAGDGLTFGTLMLTLGALGGVKAKEIMEELQHGRA